LSAFLILAHSVSESFTFPLGRPDLRKSAETSSIPTSSPNLKFWNASSPST
jgi:hypothetical protein